jgi:hypothetical protein
VNEEEEEEEKRSESFVLSSNLLFPLSPAVVLTEE